MNRVEMAKTVWEVISESDSFGAEPGYSGGVNTLHALWRGACELAKRARPVQLRKVHPITIVAGTAQYPFPDDFLRYQDVREPILIAGKQLVQLDQGVTDQLQDDPESSWVNVASVSWYEAGVSDQAGSNFQKRMLGFWPTPTANATGKLYYVRRPIKLNHASMTDSTEYRDIPEHYHMALVYWAVREFFLRQAELPVGVDPQAYELRFSQLAEEYLMEVNEEAQAARRPTTPCAFTRTLDAFMEA